MIPLPLAFGAPLLTARIRTTPDDFQVDELPAFEATGEGEHLLLHIRKRGANTVHVAKLLAKWAGLPEMAVSYAGMKDRHAVTTQRFSVHLPKRVAPDLAELASDEIEVLEATWHNRKLQRGALAGNRFRLVLREVQGDAAAISERLQQIAGRGLPNWFGEQRFVATAATCLPHWRCSVAAACARTSVRCCCQPPARRCSIVCSPRAWSRATGINRWTVKCGCSMAAAACSAPNPTPTCWPSAWPVSTSIPARRCGAKASCAAPTLHVSWSWPRWTTRNRSALRAGLEDARLKQERRALRLRPALLQHQWLASDVLELSFALPPGCYATAVLHELGPVEDAAQPDRKGDGGN